MSRILLADDHPMIRTALDVLLRDSDFDIVGMAGSGEEALRSVEELNPDLLILDLQMPGGGGMSVLRRLRAEGKKLKIVLLTAAIDDATLLEAKALKVQGMVLKNSDPAYLLDCLDHLRLGRSWIDPELAGRLKDLSAGKRQGGGKAILAPRELQLIGFVREGLRNRDIAAKLGVTEGTVKTYLHSVFEKLGVSSRTELAMRAEEFFVR